MTEGWRTTPPTCSRLREAIDNCAILAKVIIDSDIAKLQNMIEVMKKAKEAKDAMAENKFLDTNT